MRDDGQRQMTPEALAASVAASRASINAARAASAGPPAAEFDNDTGARRMKVPTRGVTMLRMATAHNDADSLTVACDLCHEVLMLTPETLDVADIAAEVLDHMQEAHNMLGDAL